MTVGKRSKGFSLIEVLISVILVGVSIAALMMANGSFTMANGAGADLSTAEFLIEQIRELTTMLPVMDPDATTPNFGLEEAMLADYDDLDDFDGMTFSPPIGADRTTLNDLATYSQQITVENVSPSDFNTVVGDGTTDFVRVSVSISLNGHQISSASWIRARY